MKKIILSTLIVFVCTIGYAQNDPYSGGIGRGDARITKINTPLVEVFIYYGGIGRGDIMVQLNAGPALPIELVRFDAILQNRIVDLTWQTASEHNNDFFTVERSADSYNFEAIANLDGAGNSTELLSYATQDLYPLNGVSYYRLKQTDFDGAFEYSDLRVVNLGADDDLLVFPNPSNTGLIHFQNPVDIGELAIYSSEGKLVFREMVGNTLQVKLNPGVYLVRYEVAGLLKTKKIVITN